MSTATKRAAAPHQDATAPKPGKKCRHCGCVVSGDHGERVAHLKECRRFNQASSSTPPPHHREGDAANDVDVQQQRRTAETPDPVVLRPLPVCSACGKLFRSEALLSEHTCPWAKKTAAAAAAAGTSAAAEGSAAAGREALQGPVQGRRVEAYRAEVTALRDYDQRMQRLLSKQLRQQQGVGGGVAGGPASAAAAAATTSSLSSSQLTTRSTASLASVTGGAERTRCRRCGKSILTSMLRHHREACIVLRLSDRIDRLKELVAAAAAADAAAADVSASTASASPAPAHQATATVPGRAVARLDVPAPYARLEEADLILSALVAVISLPPNLRQKGGTVALGRVGEAMPDIEAAFEAWRQDVAVDPRSRNRITLSPVPMAASPTNELSPTPNLRAVLHHPPADLSPTRTKRANSETLRRCEALASTKKAAAGGAGDAPPFDASTLAIAEAVRRGDLTLSDATLPNFGHFKATGFSSAIDPSLRSNEDATLSSRHE